MKDIDHKPPNKKAWKRSNHCDSEKHTADDLERILVSAELSTYSRERRNRRDTQTNQDGK